MRQLASTCTSLVPPPQIQEMPDVPPYVPPWIKERPDMRYITLIRYRKDDEEAEFRLLQEIQEKWYNIGLELLHSSAHIESHKDEEKCRDVLTRWLERGSDEYPVEWGSLVKVLQKVQLKEVAKRLREALNNKIQ